jgi:hypothetical protein
MEIVYRGYGPHQRKGGGFSTLGVRSEEELEEALSSGWYRTLPEAIEAHDNPKPIIPVADAVADPLGDGKKGGSRDDGDPVTREELETNAKKLGVKFDGRTSNASLLRKINEALNRGV